MERAITLTLLPGLHGTAGLYNDLAMQLASLGYTTHCIEYPTDGDQSLETLSTVAENQIDWNSPQILVAESFSGAIALQLADAYPESVVGLVLGATFCCHPMSRWWRYFPFTLALPVFKLPPPDFALNYFFMEDGSPDTVRQSLRAEVTNCPATTTINRIEAALDLEEIDCPTCANTPTLILQAENDELVDWNAQQRLERHLSHAEVHWLEAPHLIFQTRPKICAELIHDFIKNSCYSTS